MTIRICVAGATGWVGEALCPAIKAASDLKLVGAVARKSAGRPVPSVPEVTLSASLAEALKVPADVLIDYTHPGAVKSHVLTAVEAGIGAVIGTSGLSAADYAEIDRAARKRSVGVIAAGNFSLTAALMLRFATMAAEHVPQWEVLDFASFTKPDAPSGTARELAERLGEVRKPRLGVAIEAMHGPKETRGADIAGTRVHSLRLPGFVIACEAVFGAESERLSIRHEAGMSPAPYVAGTLLAARKVGQVTGLIRGLDRLLFD
ncbi:MAG TPA: 4-hydroxy-tetrahydrodipicolinate reductase [Alphaproteobacteria bacterium]|nr:4-hydroxy-tetrahydrodipicolinate reductase [Alphaproteobacteria bacterium]